MTKAKIAALGTLAVTAGMLLDYFLDPEETGKFWPIVVAGSAAQAWAAFGAVRK